MHKLICIKSAASRPRDTQQQEPQKVFWLPFILLRTFPPLGSGLMRFRRGYSSGAAPDFYRIPWLKFLEHYFVVFLR
jgi:hypothetical protein